MSTDSQGKKDKDPKVEQALLDEDDDFEEFVTEDWTAQEEDQQDKQVWEDNWDDDKVADDFSIQLRAELEKLGHKITPGQKS